MSEQNKKETGKEITIISGIQSDSFWNGVTKILKHLDMYCICMLPVSILASYLLFLCNENYLSHISNIQTACIDYCPMLIGLFVAAYVFLLKLDSDTRDKVSKHAGKGQTAASIFIAFLLWFTFITFLVFILSLMSKIIDNIHMSIVLYGFIYYSAFLFVDGLLHMYGFHSFVYPITDVISNEEATKNKKNRIMNFFRQSLLWLYLLVCLIVTSYSIYKLFSPNGKVEIWGAEIDWFNYLIFALSIGGILITVDSMKKSKKQLT